MEAEETQYIPPPISNLLKYPIGNDVNIEDGLCKPQDENLFLLSSIAFLQKQLLRKLSDQNESKQRDNVHRKYSDLLLVESGEKYRRQKCFIRLPNMEKFDELMKSEASIPEKILSNTQILPLPKKTKSVRLSISNIFKQRANITMLQNVPPKKTHSVFNIFRKNSITDKISDTNLKAVKSIIQIVPEYNPERGAGLIEQEKNEHPSYCSLISLSSVRINTPKENIKDFKLNITSDEHPKCTPPASHRNKELSDIEEEILKVIPTETNLEIKKSINANLRISRGLSMSSLNSYKSSSEVKFVKREDDFFEDPQTGIKFKCISNMRSKSRKIREQQSKLSVCMEDDPDESDLDQVFSQQRHYPFNCTDDVKAMVSSETISVIMSELLHELEEHIQN